MNELTRQEKEPGIVEIEFDPYHGGDPVLVLSRRIGEEILIGDDIRISVLRSKNGKVRIGISAPDDVGIRRAEVPPMEPANAAPPKTRLRRVGIVTPQNPVLDCASFI